MTSTAQLPPVHVKKTRFDQKKQDILNAASALFNRHGLKDATLAAIAFEIGLNLKSLRYYYERRDDLVAAAFLRSIEWHRTLAESVVGIDDFDERIRSYLRSYFSMRARIARGDEPNLVHFGDLRALTEPHLDEVGSAYVDMFRATRRLFPRDRPGWDETRRSAGAHMLLSQVHWSVVWAQNYLPEDLPRAAERLADILLNGVAAEGREVAEHVPVTTPQPDLDRLSRESFLRAATTLINDQGYRGASVERISALLGVTKGAFYHHNETRDDLVTDCFKRTFDIIRAAQDAALALGKDSFAHLQAAAASLIHDEMGPDGVLLRTSALTVVGPELRRDMQQQLTVSTGRFADMISDGNSDGSIRPCDVRIAAEAITGAINSAQELQRWVPAATHGNAVALYAQPLFHGFERAALL